jgi:hypothetical protein
VSAAVVALALMLIGFFWIDPFQTQPVEAKDDSAQVPSVQYEATRQAEPELASHSVVLTSNELFELWDAPLVPANVSAEQFDFDREFGLRGFELLRRAGSVDDVANLNLPFLVPTVGGSGMEYIAVVGLGKSGDWQVTPDYQGRKTLSSQQLDEAGDGTILLPWSDFATIDKVTVPGMKGENVRRLQYLLGLTGCMNIAANGRYDSATISCIKDFQQANSLSVDGLVGPETLILLYHAAGAYEMPRLRIK